MHAFLFRLGGGAAEDEEVVPQRHLDLVLVPERLAAGFVPAREGRQCEINWGTTS